MITRARAWAWVRRNRVEGEILPRWMIAVRAILYPLDFLAWWRSRLRGYDVFTDTWTIHGVRYAGSALALLAETRGETYRIERVGDTVVLCSAANPKEVRR